MAGRPTKPKSLKIAQGTYRKSREIIALDLQPLAIQPTAPENFDADEKWFFNMACEALFNSGMLRSADLMTIESMAGWWSIMKKSQEDIRTNGMFQISEKSGWKSPSASVAVFEKAWNKLKDFTDRYGFNLISKDKIQAPVRKNNEINDLLNG